MSMPPRDSTAGRIKLGWEDFLELPEDGNRYEILDGELVRTVKAQLYARLGVVHYWIVDAEARAFDAYELDGGSYRHVASLVGDGRFEPVPFPGLTVELSAIWV